MPDITMCPDDECRYRKTCRRSASSGTRPSYWQSWGFFIKTGKDGKPENCEGYWPVEKTK